VLAKLTETQGRRHPIGRKVMTYNHIFVARVHRPHSFDKLGFGFRHAFKLP
jgi:hypothetical protein